MHPKFYIFSLGNNTGREISANVENSHDITDTGSLSSLKVLIQVSIYQISIPHLVSLEE